MEMLEDFEKMGIENLKEEDLMADKLIENITGCMVDMANGDEAVAEDLYNDKFVMCDILGENLFTMVPLMEEGSKNKRENLALRVYRKAHTALKEAALMFVKNQKGK